MGEVIIKGLRVEEVDLVALGSRAGAFGARAQQRVTEAQDQPATGRHLPGQLAIRAGALSEHLDFIEPGDHACGHRRIPHPGEGISQLIA